MGKIYNLAILGPTGSGKTAVAHLLAEVFSADIVSCDSMQVYREMNIGVAKPSKLELNSYNYHLVDILKIDEPWNLDRFLQAARPLILALNQKGKSVVLVGGTGLYAKALLYNYQLPKAEPGTYRKIYTQAQTTRGRSELHLELEHRGMVKLAESARRNPRRLARVIEVVREEGQLPRENHSAETGDRSLFADFKQFILLPPTVEHRTAIRERTICMLNHGWLDEADKLLKAGLTSTPTARQVLGYREVASYLRGTIPKIDQLIEIIANRTWQYARRQRTWFRHQHPGAFHLPLRPGLRPDQVGRAIAGQVRIE